jgi:hypothetical protein
MEKSLTTDYRFSGEESECWFVQRWFSSVTTLFKVTGKLFEDERGTRT